MGIRPSRQANRMYRIMKDPEGPQMKRIDTIVDNTTWEIFRDIRDSMNLTQRQALEFALQLAFLFQTVQGKISTERFTELAPMLMPKKKAKRTEDSPDDLEQNSPKSDDQDPEEPEPAE